jgi:hypothetical protein
MLRIRAISEARIDDGVEPEIQPQRLHEGRPARDGGIVRTSRKLEEVGRNVQPTKEVEVFSVTHCFEQVGRYAA